MKMRFDSTKDLDGALMIARDLPDFFTDAALENIRKSLSEEMIFNAYGNNDLVGFLTAKERNSYVVELTWMAIKRDFQKQGMGSKLLENALDSLRKKYRIAYVKTLDSSVNDAGYSKTRKFWIGNGFYQLETIDPYPGWDPGNPCLILVKPL
jgi:ribosomal protein S18 acetylase RimI-like enzyme